MTDEPVWKPPYYEPDWRTPWAEKDWPTRLKELRWYYTPSTVPPCIVCGDALSAGSFGGGRPTIWSCSNLMEDPNNPDHLIPKPGRERIGTPKESEHYRRSRYEQTRTGDSRVLSLIDEFERRWLAEGGTPGEAERGS